MQIMELKRGQKVSFIDDDITGIVVKVEENYITIETEDGFLLEASPGELIIHKELDVLNLHEEDFPDFIEEKKAGPKRKKPTSKRQKSQPPMEVDLHAHQLTSHEKRMSSFDILNLQLDTARTRLEFAIAKRIPKVVFIHGVGEGVLRMELETLLSRYSNITFYDADFRKYGLGATEVYIYQNPRQ